jgi:hypothetical protein
MILDLYRAPIIDFRYPDQYVFGSAAAAPAPGWGRGEERRPSFASKLFFLLLHKIMKIEQSLLNDYFQKRPI